MNKDKNPLISFIIPYYNVSNAFFTECINSIIAIPIDAEEKEIIVVDDGSDNAFHTPNITSEQAITVIRQAHSGVSSARNKGLSIAKGKYIHFIDADDKIINHNYSHLIEHIKTEQYDIICTNLIHNKKKIHDQKHIRYRSMSGAKLMKKHNINSSVSCYIFRKRLAKDILFDEDLAYSEDDDYVTRAIIKAENALQTNSICYFYRQHSYSVLYKTTKDKASKRLNDIRKVIEKISLLSKNTPEERKAIERRQHQMIMNYIYIIITLTQSFTELNRRIDELKSKKLFPIPIKWYTLKYVLFATTCQTRLGRYLMTSIYNIIHNTI